MLKLEYHAEGERVTQLAMWVGRATYAANHQATQPHRDSEASRVAAEASKKRRAAAKAAAVTAAAGNPSPPPRIVFARPVALGRHTLVQAEQGWRCTTCKRTSAKWKTIAPAQCDGSAARRWADKAAALADRDIIDGGGHRRILSGDVLW